MRVIVLMLSKFFDLAGSVKGSSASQSWSDGHEPTPGPLAASILPNPREIFPVAMRGLGAVERRVNPMERSAIGFAGRIHVC